MICIYDIEVFPNCFTITFLDIATGEIYSFVIFSYQGEEINDYEELLEFLKGMKGLIGYNNINYDYPILHSIMSRNLTSYNAFDITDYIYSQSYEIIHSDYSAIRTKQIRIPQLDLYRIWHFDNKNKATSLKHVEIAINFPNVEDLPYDPDHTVLPDQVEGILSYNLNDVKATYQFYLVTRGQTDIQLHKGLDKIQLRKDIIKQYRIPCINDNDIKIGGSITSKFYSEISGKSFYEYSKLGTHRDRIHLIECVPNYIEFVTPYMQEVLEKIKATTIRPEDKFKIPVIIGHTKYLIAKGGLHSDDKPRKLTNSQLELIDADVALKWRN